MRMNKLTKIKAGITAVFFVLAIVIVLATGMGRSAFDAKIGKIVAPYQFNLFNWEIEALSYQLDELLFGDSNIAAEDSQMVLEYFEIRQQASNLEWQIELVVSGIKSGNLEEIRNQLKDIQQQMESLRTKAEKVLELQIQATMAKMDIYNPLDEYLNIDITFPPVSFELEAPPYLLVISPNDSIERIKEIMLSPDLAIEERIATEENVDELGVSSLVVGIGGIATYPSFVIDTASLQRTIEIAVEEWLHQYLFFRPLGFYYALHIAGVARDYDIAVMNETAVGIASDEIGAILYKNYYASYIEEEDNSQPSDEQEEEPAFDFYEEMRQIRLAVDELLANGQVDEAEAFMEEKRLFILSNGYYIRKLNQAYFAFYGTYASSPTSVNPIGEEFRELREQVDSISQFLNTAAAMTSRGDLVDSIN